MTATVTATAAAAAAGNSCSRSNNNHDHNQKHNHADNFVKCGSGAAAEQRQLELSGGQRQLIGNTCEAINLLMSKTRIFSKPQHCQLQRFVKNPTKRPVRCWSTGTAAKPIPCEVRPIPIPKHPVRQWLPLDSYNPNSLREH